MAFTVSCAGPGRGTAGAPSAQSLLAHALARSGSRSPTNMLVNGEDAASSLQASMAPPSRVKDSPATWIRPGPEKGSMKTRLGQSFQAPRVASRYIQSKRCFCSGTQLPTPRPSGPRSTIKVGHGSGWTGRSTAVLRMSVRALLGGGFLTRSGSRRTSGRQAGGR